MSSNNSKLTDHLGPSQLPTSAKSRVGLGALAALAVLGAAVPSIVSANGQPRPALLLAGLDEPLDLQNVAVGELAAELERLGLEINVAPAQDDLPTGEIDAQSGDWIDDQPGEEVFEDEPPLASFDRSGDRSGEQLESPTATVEQTAQAMAIWDRFTQIIPADQIRMVIGFELLSEGFAGAYVYPDEEDPTEWILGVGLGMEGAELDSTLVHEFGHLLTLNASEVPPGGEFDSCPTYNPGEGCALQQSTLAEFVAEFWPPPMRDEIERINESGDWDALDDFYEQNADSFVTDYATTNPVEDLAETFAEFVLTEQPDGDTVAEQKMQMLWNDAGLVVLRSEIRARLQ